MAQMGATWEPSRYCCVVPTLVVSVRDVPVGVVLQLRRRHQAEDRASQDIGGDGVTGAGLRQQPGSNQWSRTACDDRRQLIAERCAAVAQPPREGFRD